VQQACLPDDGAVLAVDVQVEDVPGIHSLNQAQRQVDERLLVAYQDTVVRQHDSPVTRATQKLGGFPAE